MGKNIQSVSEGDQHLIHIKNNNTTTTYTAITVVCPAQGKGDPGLFGQQNFMLLILTCLFGDQEQGARHSGPGH